MGEIERLVGLSPEKSSAEAFARRALAVWPRLDRNALRRCGSDPERLARLVERRTSLGIDAVRAILARPAFAEDERLTWLG